MRQEASTRVTLQELLDRAAKRIRRYAPADAHAAVRAGATLVDIRDSAARDRDGVVPGALHIPRTVLEWRLAPGSAHRSPHVGGLEAELVLLCDHGCSTVLAGAVLADLGFARVGDVVGGYVAWKAEGLPTRPGPVTRSSPDVLPGAGPPD